MDHQTPTTNTCYELRIQIPENTKDTLAVLLEEHGIDSFVYGECDCDLDAEFTLENAQRDLYDSLQSNPPLIVYHEDQQFLTLLQSNLTQSLQKNGFLVTEKTFVLRPIAQQNWQENWKLFFQPVTVNDRFVILPPWENPNTFSHPIKIVIDPGMAFGTGQHETTQLCLHCLDILSAPEVDLQAAVPLAKLSPTYQDHTAPRRASPAQDRLLDVGTGSGILAIAAQKMGFAHIHAIDLDPTCLPVAIENAAQNQTEGIVFADTPLHDVHTEPFDVIVANIQSGPLMSLVPDMKRLLKPHGALILSGILASEMTQFLEFLREQDYAQALTYIQKDWCAIVCFPH